jgi:hypothetical protein
VISYAYFADQVLIAVYQRCGRTPQKPCRLYEILDERGFADHADWLATLTSDFAEKGYWDVEIGDGPMVHLTAAGIREAERLIAAEAEGNAIGPASHLVPAPPVAGWREWSGNIDWTKWGTILTGAGIVVAVLLWLFS